MGYRISMTDSSFNIKKENVQLALNAFNAHFGDPAWRAAQYLPPKFLPFSSLDEALSAEAWEVETDEHGNIVDIIFEGEKSYNEDTIFEAIGPYVEKGSFIVITGEDDRIYRYYFNGKEMVVQEPTIVWPEE